MRAIASDVAGLTALIVVEKATATFRFTTHNASLLVDGVTYTPGPGAMVTSIQFPSDGTEANADVNIMVTEDGVVEAGDGARGILDGWPISISLVDPSNILNGTYAQLIGTIGSVNEDANGMATIAASGLLRQCQERPLCEHYTSTCAADLGDDRCKIPILADQQIEFFDIGREQEFVRPDIDTGLLAVSDAYGRVRNVSSPSTGAVEEYGNVYFECTVAGTTAAAAGGSPDVGGPPTYNFTLGSTTVDGTATFTTRNSWTRYARGQALDNFTIQLTALPDPRATETTWYQYGGLFIRSGLLSGYPKYVIRAWDPTYFLVTLALPISVTDIPADTQFEIYPGCDLTREMCFGRFLNSANPSGTNIENQRAFTFVPSPDIALTQV